MNIQTNKSDDLLREVFSKIPSESPSEDFTHKVMDQIARENVEKLSINANFNLVFRTLLALALTIGFFGILIFTSDFSFMDYIYQIFSTLKFKLNPNQLFHPFVFLSKTNNLSLIVGLVMLAGGALLVFSHNTNKKDKSPGMDSFLSL